MSVVEMRAGAFVLVGTIALLAPFLGAARGETEDVQLRFEAVDLLTFVDWISRQGELNLLLPKETETLEGQKVTIRFAAKIPEDTVLDVAIAVLHIHGYDLVPLQDRARTFKLVATTKLASEPVEFRGSIDEELAEGPDRYVAQLIRLEHMRTSEFLAALRQGRLLDETRASVFEFSDKNVLILLDYASSIRRVLEIAKTLDVPPPRCELVVEPSRGRRAASSGSARLPVPAQSSSADGYKEVRPVQEHRNDGVRAADRRSHAVREEDATWRSPPNRPAP